MYNKNVRKIRKEMIKMKIDKRKNYKLVLDVETANSQEQPFVYDIGFAVVDNKGNIYEEKSFIIRDIFILEKELMKSAYYAVKVPKYWVDIKEGKRQVVDFMLMRWIVLETMKKYNIKTVCAYNASFDINALNTTIRWLTKSAKRYFFPFGTKVECIWSMCCSVLYIQKSYQKMAKENGWVSEKGYIKTKAEQGYNYLHNTTDFEESHTGLEDVKIEIELMARCLRQHKKMEKNPKRGCWRLCQPAVA